MTNAEGPSEKDLSTMLEDEHLLLQRHFRSMETDRRHTTLGVHPQHRRQVALSAALRDEYTDLEKDLKIARSGAHKKKDEKMTIDLRNALLMNQSSKNNTDDGFLVLEEFSGLVHRNAKEVLQLRKIDNSSIDKVTERQLQSEQRLAAMENRLEVATRRFNAVYYENTRLRDEIEHMLKDRAIFNESWVKMITSLNKGKRYLRDLFAQSTMAYDQRDEWCSKLHSVQEKGKMDLILQTQEMRELQKALDHEWKTHRFLAAKGVTRVNKDLALKQEELEAKEIEMKQEQLEFHNKLIRDIQDYADNYDFEMIVEQFKITEVSNNAIFRLICQICVENTYLQQDLKNISHQIENRKSHIESLREHLHYNHHKLQTELDRFRESNQLLRSVEEEQTRTLDRIEHSIADMFGLLGCSMEPFEKLLGDKTPSFKNSLLSLTLIAEKIIEHISIVYYNERYQTRGLKTIQKGGRLKKFTITQEAVPPLEPADIRQLVRAEPCSVCMEARWMAKVTEQAERPISREEATQASRDMNEDPAYEREDLAHSLTECRLPRFRGRSNDVY